MYVLQPIMEMKKNPHKKIIQNLFLNTTMSARIEYDKIMRKKTQKTIKLLFFNRHHFNDIFSIAYNL